MAKKAGQVTFNQKDIQTIDRQDSRHAYFANFFSIQVSEDDVTFGFGQKILPTNGEDAPVNEVGQKIIMTHKGAKVLYDLLSSAFESKNEEPEGSK